MILPIRILTKNSMINCKPCYFVLYLSYESLLLSHSTPSPTKTIIYDPTVLLGLSFYQINMSNIPCVMQKANRFMACGSLKRMQVNSS